MAENEPHPFVAFFLRVTGRKPYRYQVRLATVRHVPEVLDVPTGLGKTAAIILTWLWNRNAATPAVNLPRRLIYCLPMRTLVAQTARVAKGWIEKAASAGLLRSDCRVHVLMGGEQTEEWDLQPEADAVLIGTQDMLLSRLLNRGYGMSRYRWPMQFGLLGNDCLWVMDEVQLMGTGLATTVQVDLFQKSTGGPSFRVTSSGCRRPWGLRYFGPETVRIINAISWIRNVSFGSTWLKESPRILARKPKRAFVTALPLKSKSRFERTSHRSEAPPRSRAFSTVTLWAG